MNLHWLSIGIFLSIGIQSGYAAPKCMRYSSEFLGRSVNYCIERSHPERPQAAGESVVYFMHGLAGGAKSWLNEGYSEALAKLNSEGRVPSMTFVSFDTSAVSFFSDRGGVDRGGSAYESWLIEEFMPWIETLYGLCKQKSCRMLAGFSMGGFGALKTALRHTDLFGAVAVNSPALPIYNAQEDWDLWMTYFERHPVGRIQGSALLWEARKIFSSWAWSDLNDPAYLVANLSHPAEFPAVYLDVGGRDYFGFQEGFIKFKEVLQSSHLNAKMVLVPEAGHELYRKRGLDALRFLANYELTRRF